MRATLQTMKTDTRSRIVQCIQECSQVTPRQLMQNLGVSAQVVHWHLRKLKIRHNQEDWLAARVAYVIGNCAPSGNRTHIKGSGNLRSIH